MNTSAVPACCPTCWSEKLNTKFAVGEQTDRRADTMTVYKCGRRIRLTRSGMVDVGGCVAEARIRESTTALAEAQFEIARLHAALAAMTAERDKYRLESAEHAMGDDFCGVMRQMLIDAGTPVAAFVDDHLRNLIIERDEARAEVARLRAERHRDAGDGQGALDEANSEVVRLRAALDLVQASQLRFQAESRDGVDAALALALVRNILDAKWVKQVRPDATPLGELQIDGTHISVWQSAQTSEWEVLMPPASKRSGLRRE